MIGGTLRIVISTYRCYSCSFQGFCIWSLSKRKIYLLGVRLFQNAIWFFKVLVCVLHGLALLLKLRLFSISQLIFVRIKFYVDVKNTPHNMKKQLHFQFCLYSLHMNSNTIDVRIKSKVAIITPANFIFRTFFETSVFR